MTHLFKHTVVAALLSTAMLLSPFANAAPSADTSLISEKENAFTEGYTRPLDLKVRKASKSMTLMSKHYESRQFDIFYIDAWLFNDDDHDGFYSSFDLTFDLDVDYGSARVYADIWIRPENGYYELLHTTDIFTIEGYGTHDEYQVSTDLIDDFPVGYYDILIELFDVEHNLNIPVASAGSNSFDSLYALPLESRERYYDHGSVGVTISAAAGSFWFLLAPLCALLASRLRRSPKGKSLKTQCNK